MEDLPRKRLHSNLPVYFGFFAAFWSLWFHVRIAPSRQGWISDIGLRWTDSLICWSPQLSNASPSHKLTHSRTRAHFSVIAHLRQIRLCPGG